MENDKSLKIKKAIEKVAKELDKDPSEVTKGELLTSKEVSDWSLKMVGGLTKVKSAYFPSPKDLATVTKLNNTSSYIKQLEKRIGGKELLEQEVREALKSIKVIAPKPYKQLKKKKTSRVINLLLSDLHIGSNIKKEETGSLSFGKVEEARRLARVTKEVIEYKRHHRDDTELKVVLLGDLIQGSLHDPRDGAPIAEQVCRAIHLLSQTLGLFSANFPKVTVYSVTGNHDRIGSRHHSRAVNQKWDSYQTMIAFALKNICKSYSNVDFEIPKTPYITYENFGKKLFFSHGDTVLNPGYPNKSIKTAGLEQQINKINASLPDSEEYSVFAVGHVHVGSITHLSNGSVMITNAALVPTDEFGVSIGLLENSCGQYLFESVEDFPVGDCRLIRVSSEDDSNSSLDSIIQKFESL